MRGAGGRGRTCCASADWTCWSSSRTCGLSEFCGAPQPYAGLPPPQVVLRARFCQPQTVHVHGGRGSDELRWMRCAVASPMLAPMYPGWPGMRTLGAPQPYPGLPLPQKAFCALLDQPQEHSHGDGCGG